jgi:hypothetical protein
MKGQLKRISIPNPCTMQWEEMEPVDEKSRSCSSCEKVVRDFTQMSDEELISYFQQNGNVCGRFFSHQVDKDLLSPNIKRNGIFFKKLVLLNSFLFSVLTVVKAEPVLRKNAIATQIPAVNFFAPENNIPTGNPGIITISGTVKDSSSQGTIHGILIDLYYGNDSLHCFTDTNGNYTFSLQHIPGLDSFRIVVDENYYDKFEKVIRVKETGEIKMDVQLLRAAIPPTRIESVLMMGGAVSTCHSRNRPVHNFFYKLFHPRTW